ncbi:MAG: HEAT repeat domain-containing protein [Gemmatimonadales bacterium]|nr:HEAT repeat domain-containing protein [Gemmatimonadales bacterium]
MRLRTLFALLVVPVAAAAQVTTAPVTPRSPAPIMTTVPSAPFGSYSRLAPSISLDPISSVYSLDHFGDAQLHYTDALDRYALSVDRFSSAFDGFTAINGSVFGHQPPSAWAHDDPADSLYRLARETLNRGDYRRAASLFGDITKRFPTSVYSRDVPYWQAFALYRIGGTTELQEALGILERWRAAQPAPEPPKGGAAASSPGATFRNGTTVLTPRDAEATKLFTTSGNGITWASSGNRPDGDALAARIAGVLSSRGMSNDPLVRRALTARGADACDQEEQAVRSEALNALLQSDPETARSVATRTLARKDDCSVPLRRTALFVLAGKKDPAATSTLISVARNDPSTSMRLQAIDWLGSMPGDDAVATLEELTRSSDASVQRAAARALAANSSPRAKAAVRAVIERNDADESLRVSLVEALSGERTSADDAAWLRAVYDKTTSARVQSRIASAIARVGGEANVQWLTALARNEDEPLDSRLAAMRSISSTADVATLIRLYDAATHQRIRGTLISALGDRKESAALDKLIDIARTGTDPSARRQAISELSSSKDPRATKLLLELVDK